MPKPPVARFVAPLVRMDEGARHHIVPVPEQDAAAFKSAQVRRVICTINGQQLRRALHRHADGGSFILLGGTTVRDLGLKRGTQLAVELRADPKPEELDVPEEFAIALAQDDAARARWDTFTTGFKRSLLHYVSSAKQEPTRIKRSLDLLRKIRTQTLHSDRQK